MSRRDQKPMSRRDFVRAGAAVTAGIALPTGAYAHGVHATGSDTIRIGVIGCGGRGTGAAFQSIEASEGVELVAMGDLVADRLERSRESIAERVAERPELASRMAVTDERCFTGFDAYLRVLESDVDLVILATPPGFRPLHLAAAVDAGKHVFAEKPVAVDAAGVRRCLETHRRAVDAGLGIGVGTQRRHHPGYVDWVRRIHDGALGDVLNGQVYWNQGGLWSREREPGWSDTEWQIRNWLYFAWLSGDHIVEQHVHQLDVANWVLDAHPVRATAVGGRQQRTQPVYGHIYDHFAVDFEYPGGVHILSMARQIDRAEGRIGEWFQGSRGRAQASESRVPIRIEGAHGYEWERPDGFVIPMVQEHADLVASIRAGKPIQDLGRIAESTLTAILGREAAYTGRTLEWEEVLEAEQDLAPVPLAELGFGPLDVPPVPVPGRTELARMFKEGW